MSAIIAAHSTSHSPLPPPRHHQLDSSPPQHQPLTPSRRAMASVTAHRQSSHGSSHSPPEGHRAALPGSHGTHTPPHSANSLRSKLPPTSAGNAHIPIIKKERQSSADPPPPPTERHRPRRLDLSSNTRTAEPGRPSAPLTSQRSAGLSAMQDVGLACLSPGFQTQDPQMQQQLQRSMDLREQQRQIIEARQRSKDSTTLPDSATLGRGPATSRRKGPPTGLSIHPPSAAQFASEHRAIQSAPLHQSFTGLRPGQSHVHPLRRQILDAHQEHRPHPASILSGPGSPSHHENRLPPISDVFRDGVLGASQPPPGTLSRHESNGFGVPPAPSPGFPPNPPSSAGLHPPPHHPAGPPHSQPPSRQGASSIPPITSARQREFKSAEDAVQVLSGGREDLLPKIVHYGGHQPPTPPSPLPPGNPRHAPATAPRSLSSRRRTREEYERDYGEGERMEIDARSEKRHYAPWDERDRPDVATAATAGMNHDHTRETEGGSWERGRQPPQPEPLQPQWEHSRARENGQATHGPFGYGRDSPETQRRKKEEFLALCSRAWDLFHS